MAEKLGIIVMTEVYKHCATKIPVCKQEAEVAHTMVGIIVMTEKYKLQLTYDLL